MLSKFLAKEEVANIMFTKADEEKARKFWEEELREKGRAEGRAEVLAEGMKEGLMIAIRNLMKTMKLSAGQAMDALQIPDSDRDAYVSML